MSFTLSDISDFHPPKQRNYESLPRAVQDNKTHILLLLPFIIVGGADMFNLELVKRINRDKYKFSVFTTVCRQNESEWTQILKDNCFNFTALQETMPASDWPSFISHYIETQNVDALWNFNSFFGYYLLPWLRVRFENLALADCIHVYSPYWRNGGYARLSAAFQEVSDLTITSNQLTLDAIIKSCNMKQEHCKAFHIGTDTEFFDPDKVPFGTIRDKYAIEHSRPLILFLCRLSPEKRPLLMLKAAAKLIEKRPDVCFLIVGDGEMRERIEEERKILKLENHVILAGSQEDVRPCYKDSDLLLICSLKEGITQTTFEAMSMGLPIVSADVGGQSELVNDDTGKLVPCLQDETDLYGTDYKTEEIESYVNALLGLLDNLENMKEMGKRNRRIITQKYTIDHAVRNFESFTDEILNEDKYLGQRRNVYNQLKKFPLLCEEIIILYVAYEKEMQLVIEMSSARQSLQNLETVEESNEHLLAMMNWYANFLTKTIIGKLCWKIMRAAYRLLRRKKEVS